MIESNKFDNQKEFVMTSASKKEPFKVNSSKSNLSSLWQSTANHKSLIDNVGTILQLSQPDINFINTLPNQIYEISMSVRNVSNASEKIKIKKPISPRLTIVDHTQCCIAAGLNMKITVQLDSKENTPLVDRIVILGGSCELQVPIYVHPDTVKLSFDPFLNFGFIAIGNTKECTWNITNIGENISSVKLVPELSNPNAKITISPEECVLAAKEKKQIKISITATTQGLVEGTIEILPKTFAMPTVEIVANFCEFIRMISDKEGNKISELAMEPLFAGEKARTKMLIVNNTPKACEYRVIRKKGQVGEEASSLVTPEEIGRDDSEKLISFSPSQGEIEAYSAVEFTADIQSKFDQSDTQIFCNYILGRVASFPEEKEWQYVFQTHIKDEESPLDLTLKGKSAIPKVALSSTYFQFGDCFLKTKNEKSLRIQNYSCKRIVVQFDKSSNYLFTPQKLGIQKNEQGIVIVAFKPKIVGELNEKCCMSIGEFSFPIKMLGRGIFGSSKFNNQLSSTKIELIPSDMNQTELQNQISEIQQPKSKLKQSGQKAFHFENYRNSALNSTLMNQTSLPCDNSRKTRTLHNRNGKDTKIDVKNMNPHKPIEEYPSTAKNQQQERIVARELTSHELINIAVGPVVIDIGTIFLRASKRMTFHICNFNSKPIAIKLLTGGKECFSETIDQRQILPADSHSGFNIVFQALIQGHFRHNLQYSLNGHHVFELMVTGTTILPVLTLSKNQIKFIASEEDKKFEKRQTIQLNNTHNYQVRYDWKTVKDSLYSIEPASGLVQPNSSVTATIFHNFELVEEYGVKTEESLKLKIQQGKAMQVKCSSYVSECYCISKPSQVNFKQICICRSYENKILLKNVSKNFTIYKVYFEKELQNILTVSPRSGTLGSDEMIEIVFKIYSLKSIAVDSLISVVIRGCKTIQIPVKANIILPKIRVENQTINFGSTPVEGNPAVKEIVLINQSNISVDLEMRLTPDSPLYSSLKVAKGNDDYLTITRKESKTVRTTFLRINPKSRSSLTLQFTPDLVQQYRFSLPLYISGANESIEELMRECICKGLKNRLMTNEKEIDFGKIVIEQLEQNYNKCQLLQLKNPQQEAIEWYIDETSIFPFRLEKTRGKLEGFEKTTLKIFFSAESPGEYCKDINFFIDEIQNQKANYYFKVLLKGSACDPTIYFDQPYLILPLVGLNQFSTATLEIFNGGYENINLKHTIVQQFSKVNLKVNYLNGPNLGVAKKQIKVQISFSSDKPISFTIRINFYDSSNRIFPINVSGTADNCLYTMIDEIPTGSGSTDAIDRNCSFLKHYINSIGYANDQVYEFPRSLMESDFQQFHNVLSNYSAVFEKIRGQLKKTFKNNFSFEYLSEILKIIKSEGGFLNHIRPEMLIFYEEYLENLKSRAEGCETVFEYYKTMDRVQFERSYKRCWVILFYQIFKVYSQINVGKLKTGTPFYAKFTTRQKILLSWLEKAYQTESSIETPMKPSQIFLKFSNGQMLSALISKYTNIKVLQCYNKPVKNVKEQEKRCKSVIDIFAKIGINCLCRVEDFISCDEKEMMLIAENLYLILPSYLQKGDPIVFSCSLGQVITKSIEITNPSKQAITYTAKIEGSRAYSIESEAEFVIEGKKTYEIKIKYISNMNVNNMPATLTMTGKVTPKITPSTFIFMLSSVTLGRISQKAIQATGYLYEQTEFPVKVTNNFSQDAQFKIEIISDSKRQIISFFSLTPTLKIKQGESAELNMIFLPLSAETQKSVIIFKDEKVGQFQYDLTGLVESNNLSQETLRIPQILFTSKAYTIDLIIPTKNEAMLKARKNIEALVERVEKKSATKSTVFFEKYYPKISNCENYSVSMMPPNGSVVLKTDNLTIKDIEGDDSVKRQEQKVTLQINIKSAVKDGSFTLLLKNKAQTDFRKYQVLVSALSKPLRYELEMKIPFNRVLVQPLPLINLTNESNNFTIVLTNSESAKNIFTLDCEKQVTVQSKLQETINLTFRPKGQTSYNSQLKIENVTTGQIVEYEIVGIGEEAEAEQVCLQQEARKEKKHFIKLTVAKTTKCSVLSFGIEGAQFQKTFTITPENSEFGFKFDPKTAGKYEGKLLIEEDTKVHAFNVQIIVNSSIQNQATGAMKTDP